ncbi:PREDICTED: zona pellucida sperm-binding protein 2 [Nanorana parkeri]|uniref:zona pellucida sperm-binding protein 2 n=1 Tax=Nanorana parkeri TaxID=125878 RepID=UPI000854C74E|nr:PREDICTED: zona pellucida sperm-binding protein 2 [Nanorana parkeri]
MSLLDFPGPSTCLDDGIQVSKPDNILLSSWKRLHIVDASGAELEACDLHVDESTVTILEKCIDYKAGRKTAYVSIENLVYKIACHDYQADSSYGGAVVQCENNFIMTVAEPPVSTWLVTIYDGAQKKTVSVANARTYGYDLTSDEQNLKFKIRYDALGIRGLGDSQIFYQGDIRLILTNINPKITIDVKIRCVKGPFPCNNTHMNISIPPFDGTLQFIDVGNVAIPIRNSGAALQKHGLSVDLSNGTNVTISKENLKELPITDPRRFYLPSLVLIFMVDDDFIVAMSLTGYCKTTFVSGDPFCSKDGFMTVQVLSLQTRPSLNVDTVILGDGQCKPTNKTAGMVEFKFSLKECGTKMRFVGGDLLYENELRALWKDFPRRISRDSELRETVRCRYNVSDGLLFNVNVQTPSPPPVSVRHDGPISFMLNLYEDDSYKLLYQDNQYPVVKTLRDPIYLEVQVLNRTDANIELVLNDCWATMSPDPTSSPQWNVVVDGCEEDRDDYLTVFHKVSNVLLPKHRKRFEVKAFEFVFEDVSSFVFFHCSALICSLQSPDYPLCTKSCEGSRRKRDELFLNRHSVLASLPGPLLFVDSDPAKTLQDEYKVIKEITLGVLPAFGIVAVIIMVVVLLSTVRKANH